MQNVENKFKNVGHALKWINELFRNAGIVNPERETEILLGYVLKINRFEIYLSTSRILESKEKLQLEKIIQKRIERIPLQYIIRRQEFMGLDFLVETGVLIPRPETEILVEKVLEKIIKLKLSSNMRIADIGTGSGVIAISISKFAENVTVYATDLSTKSLQIAQKNAKKHKCLKKIIFLHGSLFEPFESKIERNSLDGIVSNPPYINIDDFLSLPPEVRDNEPAIALYGGIEGLDYYYKIITQSPYFLKKGGFLALEVGVEQAGKIRELILKEDRYSKTVDVFKDYSGIDRIVMAYCKR